MDSIRNPCNVFFGSSDFICFDVYSPTHLHLKLYYSVYSTRPLCIFTSLCSLQGLDSINDILRIHSACANDPFNVPGTLSHGEEIHTKQMLLFRWVVVRCALQRFDVCKKNTTTSRSDIANGCKELLAELVIVCTELTTNHVTSPKGKHLVKENAPLCFSSPLRFLGIIC